MAAVRVNGCYVVKPAEETWTGCLSLSELDQSGAIIHVSTIHLYPKPPQSWLTPTDLIPTTLKQSLSRALVPFYPLAGRLRRVDGGRLDLDCNASGAQFIEAESESRLDHYLGNDQHSTTTTSPAPPSADRYRPLKPAVDYSLPIDERPVTIVQLTRLACGAISLCLCTSHAVVDGQSLSNFLSEWARLARGEALGTVPFHDRNFLGARGVPAGLSAATSLDDSDCAELNRLPVLAESTKESSKDSGLLKISKERAEVLRMRANEGRDSAIRAYTRYETLTGHVWRCACKARMLESEQRTGLVVYVDVRNRLRPPLPSGYFGNAAIGVTATSCAGDVVSKPVGYAASIVRRAIDMVTDEYVWSYIEHLKNQEDLSKFQDVVACGNPNIAVASWMRLPMYGIDFGWGKEVFAGPGSMSVDGDSVILSSSTGDGSLIVAICLEAIHLDSFKKQFYGDII